MSTSGPGGGRHRRAAAWRRCSPAVGGAWLGPGAIGHRVRIGRLHVVYRGVYAVGHRRLTGHGRWMAAVLACGLGALLSHGSAAALWGLLDTSSARIHVT